MYFDMLLCIIKVTCLVSILILTCQNLEFQCKLELDPSDLDFVNVKELSELTRGTINIKIEMLNKNILTRSKSEHRTHFVPKLIM